MVLISHTLFFIPGAKAVSTGMMAPLSCNSLIGKLARYWGGFHGLGPLGPLGSWEIHGDSAAGEAATKGWPFSIAAFDETVPQGKICFRGYREKLKSFLFFGFCTPFQHKMVLGCRTCSLIMLWCCLWASDKHWISKLSLERSQCFQRRDRSQVGPALLLGSQRPARLVRETSSPSIASHAMCLARHDAFPGLVGR